MLSLGAHLSRRLMHPAKLSRCAALVLAVAGCGDTTGPAMPAVLEALSPTTVQGTVGAEVAQTPSVRLLARSGSPMPGEEVTFLVDVENGFTRAVTTRTDAHGIASIDSWVLHTGAGLQYVRANASGLHPVLFTAIAAPGPVAEVQRVGPEDVTTPAGALVRIAVFVVDAFGNRVPRVPVSFVIQSGGGSFKAPDTVTDSDGLASADWQLGTSTLQVGSAQVQGLPPVRFGATAEDQPWRFELINDLEWGLKDSWIELRTDGRFTTRIDNVEGGGDYVITGANVTLLYRDDFWNRVATAFDVWPRDTASGQETGSVSATRLQMSRCMTAECYARIWIYERR